MSRALARLRRVTGDPPLVKAGRGLVPTPRAVELREQVRQLVQDADAVLRPVERPALKWLSRTFTIRTSEGFVENFGPALLARIGEEAPGIRLRFMQKLDKDSTLLRDGMVDLETGVVGNSMGPEVGAQGLFRDRFVGVVRMGHPLTQAEITLKRYAEGRHISVSRKGTEKGPIDKGLGAECCHHRWGLLNGSGACPRDGPCSHRPRTTHGHPPQRDVHLSPAGDHPGDHGVVALASAHGRRPGPRLAARLLYESLRGSRR